MIEATAGARLVCISNTTGPPRLITVVRREMKQEEIPPAWATAYDRFGDASEVFTASREGLLHLHKKIDEALAKGEAAIGSDARFDFEKIAVSDTHPSRTLKPRPVLDKVMGALAIIFVVAVIVLAVYGGHALYKDWVHVAK